MGTEFRLILYARDAQRAGRAAAAAFARIAQLDQIMSDYRETSELSALCRRAGSGWVPVSSDLFRVLVVAQEIAQRTNGAFDVTVGPVVRLWRHARRTGEFPDAERLAKARALVGYAKLQLDARRRAVRLILPGMQLDLGGIAKGYAADEAMKELRRFGIERALVVAGGDIVAGAPPPKAAGWKIEVLPFKPSSGAEIRQLLLSRRAVSTSGDAEQFVEINGVRYSHIVDPRTGIGLISPSSVTVIAPTGTLSDALATAASVLGPQQGSELIDSVAGAAALFLWRDHQGIHSRASKRWSSFVGRRAILSERGGGSDARKANGER